MDIIESLIACLPPVSYDPAGVELRRELASMAALLEDAQSGAHDVLTEHQPNLTVLSLDDWERNYALPDEALGGAGASAGERRITLLTRITARGDLSAAHMVEMAALVGFPGATVTEWDVMTCEDASDLPVNDDRWIGAWRLDAPDSGANQAQLQRVIQRRKPAHTIAFVNFVE